MKRTRPTPRVYKEHIITFQRAAQGGFRAIYYLTEGTVRVPRYTEPFSVPDNAAAVARREIDAHLSKAGK